MWSACEYVIRMATMIQIRNVPDELHRRLKSCAALAGMSLSDYLLNEIRRVAERPTLEECVRACSAGRKLSSRSRPLKRCGPNATAVDCARRAGGAASAATHRGAPSGGTVAV